MLRCFLATMIAALVLSACESDPKPMVMTTQLDSIAYAVGMDIAKYYHDKQGIPLDPNWVHEGFKDMVAGDSSLKFSTETGVELITLFSKMMTEKMVQTNRVQESAFLQENLKKEGIDTLGGGVQFQEIARGTGASPRASNIVKMRFEGRLLDGTVFASSAGEPGNVLEVDIAQTLPGLQMALVRMKPGAKWRVWVPSGMGYGSESRPPISPYSLLIYDIELLEILR